MRPMKFRYEGASVILQPLEENRYLLTSLWSQTRGQGHAKGVLTKALDWADKRHICIELYVGVYGHPAQTALTNKQLIELYSKFGFEQTHKRPIRMLRRPISREIHAP